MANDLKGQKVILGRTVNLISSLANGFMDRNLQ